MKTIKHTLAVLCCGTMLMVAQPALAQQNAATPSADGKTWTVNIRNADIQAFIGQVAEMTGKNFVVDPRVRARDVTVISRQTLTSAEVYELFLAVLQVHGYAAVPSGEIIKIVPNTTAKQSNLPLTQDTSLRGEELITRVITVDNSPVEELVPVLRPLVPQYGHLAAVSSANALIISDHADNIRRMEAIIAHLDGSEAEEVEIIPLQHGWVGDIVKLLETLIPQQGAAAQGGRRQSPREGRVSVVADERTNRLIVKGDSIMRRRVADLVLELDVPSNKSGSAQVIRLSHADSEKLAELLNNFADATKETEGGQQAPNPGSKVSIQADTSLNALVIRAEPAKMEELQSIVRQLDVRRSQILIEAAIVEVGGNLGLDLGVQWAAGDLERGVGGTNFDTAGISLNDVIASVLAGEPTTQLSNGLIIGGGETDSDGNLRWGGFLQALASNSNVNLLSTPSVLTLDNQEASIVVGQNVPFVTGQSTSTGSGIDNPFQTIQRQDVGITLTVTPSLAGDSTVRLELEQEASAVQASVDGVNSVDLITSKRSIKTTVLADDGETIVLGGLIQDDVRRTETKVPILGDIPLLGVLFRSTSDSREKRNLIVFLRPTILNDSARLVGLTRQRYLGITALQFRVNRRGELERIVAEPLPAETDALFQGRTPPPAELREYMERGQLPDQEDSLRDEAMN
ncbi:general (type II) secretion pathway protein D [Alcanivorax sp. S71-1-4]|jgi:general secretion pathway protein D|uniref:type II secretion system secretin GspD n=1 Tax=Alcanivorax sp. S71-1-4 TaxID=1177159 RepID=UPI00135A27D4|nr:type II secretion system secretin GspD [Alcanivorax sp. S71-1-4]KAF0807209.1 general (type II) secretion pathway protein D [Alcanivorax sp. S71-1-4]